MAALFALCRLAADGVMMHLLKTRLLETVPDERSARIAAFLREHAAAAVGLEDLARELGLSRSRTSFVVKQLFGKSFSRLLQAERVERARHYLAGSAEKLHDIARECGFSDEFHLSRVFRQLTRNHAERIPPPSPELIRLFIFSKIPKKQRSGSLHGRPGRLYYRLK